MSEGETKNWQEQYANFQRPARLMFAVSDKIMGLLDDYSMGAFEDIDRGDLQGIVEAMTVQIIDMVREAES